ncbi:MAG: CRISPR-associated protein Csx11 [Nitrososphaerota archaeon]
MSSDQLFKNLKKYGALITFIELACLLHDLGKCSSKFIQYMLRHRTIEYYHTKVIEEDKDLIENVGLQGFFDQPLMKVFHSSLANQVVQEWKLNEVSIKDLIEKHHERDPKIKLITFIQIADRKDSADDRIMPLAKQEKETYLCSVFGKEQKLCSEDLDNARKSFYEELFNIWKSYETHLDARKLRKEVYDAFDELKCALAETRRAANDITLVDHSYAVASIMKALLAWDILENFAKSLPTDHWTVKLRVLGVGWNDNRFYGEAQSLSGVAGRERLVDGVKCCLKDLLEYEIPIGNVIYEDQNSICFLVPENTLKIFDKLREQIIKKVDELTDGSVIPVVELSDPSAYPSKVITKTLKRLRERTVTPISASFAPRWTKRWDRVRHAEVCIQCGKRPRMKDEDVCEFCLKMIRDGVSNVLTRLTVKPGIYNETVWIDEIADENGNVALIYGLIPLEKWLDGTLLKTMFVKTLRDIREKYQKELIRTGIMSYFQNYEGLVRVVQEFENSLRNNQIDNARKMLQPLVDFELKASKEYLEDVYVGIASRAVPYSPSSVVEVTMTKSPSPSRIRKIWAETGKFFEDLSTVTQSSILSETGNYCLRLKFKPKFSDEDEECLLKSIKYRMLEVEKFSSEMRLPKSDLFWDGDFMYTTIRLEHYVQGKDLMDRQERIRSLVEDIMSSGKTLVVVKIKDKKVSIGIESYDFEGYLPIRTILVSPYLFAVIVPGKLAVNLLYNKYLVKYEECFCKVSNRLPLNIGVVFFKRKFPLYVVLDVMNRFTEAFLKLSSEARTFNVIEKNMGRLLLEEADTDKIKISRGDPWLLTYELKVDDKLGDDSPDLYHPSFIVKASASDIKARDTYFELNMEKPEALLNFKDIEPKMSLKLYPSFFDFHFLRSSGERFNLVSSAGKRVHPVLDIFSLRPYFLKDLEKIVELWSIINPKNGKLTMSQVKKLEYMCVTKIEEWFKEGAKLIKNPVDDGIYQRFVEASVKNTCRGRLTSEEEAKLVQSILSGMFFDVVELFITLGSHIPLKGVKQNE